MGKGRSFLRKLGRGVASAPVAEETPPKKQQAAAVVAEVTAPTSAHGPAFHWADAEREDHINELPTLSSDVWLLAEEKLRADAKKAKIYDAYIAILEARLGADRRKISILAVRNKVKELLEAKSQELERSAFVAHANALKNVLFIRELVNSISNFSPPAAVAGAGVCLVLSLLVQAGDQQSKLLYGLKVASGVICRVNTIERVYYTTSIGAVNSAADLPPLTDEFRSTMISLCTKVLEFQARALCYMKKHEVIQIAGDMFKHNAWDTLVQDISTEEDSLFRFTSIIDSNIIQSVLKKQEADITRLQTGLDSVIEQWNAQAERKRKLIGVLQTLFTCPYVDRKERNREHVPGTCKWFVEHPKFREWMESGSLLWVSADPGCGKSVLAKYLVDAVIPAPNRVVCYFFFKDDFVDQRSSANAGCALLRQLIVQRPTSLDDASLDYMLSDGPELGKSFRNLWKYFLEVVHNTSAGEVICVLDALDECQESDRNELMHALKDIRKITSTRVKVLATSRPYSHLRREFQEIGLKIPIIHLSGEAEAEVSQISAEINLVIESRVEGISRKWELGPGESDFLQTQLLQIPNRTYLWVQLTMDVIENTPQFTRGNIKRAIKHLPETVDQAYEKILERSSDAKKAERLLRIVTAAMRPLTLQELSFSLAVEEHHLQSADVADEMEPESRFRSTVRDLCGLFVVVMDHKVYLLHQTAREFLVRQDQSLLSPRAASSMAAEGMRWKHSLDLIDSHRLLLNICLWTFSIADRARLGTKQEYPMKRSSMNSPSNPFRDRDSDGSEDSSDVDLVKAVETDVAFLEYVYAHWAEHVNRAGLSRQDILTKMALARCYSLIEQMKIRRPSLSSQSRALLFATALGLTLIMEILLDEGIDIETRGRPDPDVVSRPDKSTLKPSDSPVEGRMHKYQAIFTAGTTSLDIAVADQRLDAVRLLLGKGAKTLGGRVKRSHCPLQVAATNGNIDIASLLLEYGADVDAARHGSTTPLFCAVPNKHEAMITLLLEHGASVDERNEANETLIMCAIRAGHNGIFHRVLGLGPDLDKTNDAGETALLLAAKLGRLSMLKSLFSRTPVRTAATDNRGRSVLTLGVTSGDAKTVEALLDQGADPNSCDHDGWTPLDHAIEERSTSIMEILLSRGVNVDICDNRGMSLLSRAARLGNIHITRVLLKHGAALDIRDNDGWTPLGHAVMSKVEKLVNLLWLYGADLEPVERGRLDFWTESWYELMLQRYSKRSLYFKEQERQLVLANHGKPQRRDTEERIELMISLVDEEHPTTPTPMAASVALSLKAGKVIERERQVK